MFLNDFVANLLLSLTKLVDRSLISVDNKVNQMNWPVNITTTVSVSHTQVILLMWRVLRLRGKSARQMGRMKQSTILSITLPIVHQF